MPNLTHTELMFLVRHGFAPFTQSIATNDYEDNHIQNVRALNMRTGAYCAIFGRMCEEPAKPAEVPPAADVPGRHLQGDPGYGNSPDLIARWQVDIFYQADNSLVRFFGHAVGLVTGLSKATDASESPRCAEATPAAPATITTSWTSLALLLGEKAAQTTPLQQRAQAQRDVMKKRAE
ncbi:hypothetical protein TI39_contig616g00003 [Zymoseptoria brevis]|uniref:Uncharacterized protein n=1 Tax=Zymoseptoria brevis TaxID=1047168 RepID=A0A0F4GK27_9PEZI|nr:hypothetical protein TI39_contig616g00003 [Zymoseptoria brevis]